MSEFTRSPRGCKQQTHYNPECRKEKRMQLSKKASATPVVHLINTNIIFALLARYRQVARAQDLFPVIVQSLSEAYMPVGQQ